MYSLLRFVPKDHLSYITGLLMRFPFPGPIARLTVRKFAWIVNADVLEAAMPLEAYRSIGHFFVRDLRPGVRPIEGDFVSPVDGVLRAWGRIDDGRIEQVKGKTYSLETFLGDDEFASTFDGGIYFNFYLSPRDYHHIHSPVRGEVARSIHVPGKLWPVNDWSLGAIPDLFSVNERVITYLKSPFGLVAVVMVGATNVGKMTVTYDDFVTNVPPREKAVRSRNYSSHVVLRAGDRLGTFHMGSSVVVLIRKGIIDPSSIAPAPPCAVKYGQALLR
jgi:phosphatidylserine decarboxylase